MKAFKVVLRPLQEFQCNEHKCTEGSVSSSDIANSTVGYESVLKFSFSEKFKANIILKNTNNNQCGPQTLASVSLDNENVLLQFTDGLVDCSSQQGQMDGI